MKIKCLRKVSVFLFFFGLVGLVVSVFLGNPVGKTIARVHINNFIRENSNGMDLKLKSLRYNLVNSGYDASILDKKTEALYSATADELGVFYQDIIHNYVYTKRIVRFPSVVWFISIGTIGILIGLFCSISQRMRKFRS
jgi:hypothetical protein